MTTPRRPPGDGRDRLLTPRRQLILDYISTSMARRGCSPSMREIAEAVGLKSISTVSYHLKILTGAGYLDRGAGQPRTVVAKPSRIRVLHVEPGGAGEAMTGAGPENMASVPLFERIAAGPGVMADPGSHLRDGLQYSDETMHLPKYAVGAGVLFGIKVVGDSMINANIFDGDIVVVRQQNSADDGDIVAALINEGDEEATVKTLRHLDDHVWLLPQNPAHLPIPGDYCRLMGKVVATVHRV